MKIHLDLPWGGAFDLESQPIAPDKFYALCWLTGGVIFARALVALVTG